MQPIYASCTLLPLVLGYSCWCSLLEDLACRCTKKCPCASAVVVANNVVAFEVSFSLCSRLSQYASQQGKKMDDKLLMLFLTLCVGVGEACKGRSVD